MDTTPVQSTSLTSEQTVQIRKLHQEAKEAQKLGNRALALEKLREVKAIQRGMEQPPSVLDAPDTAPSSVKTSSSPPDTSPAKEALSDPFASLPLAPSSPPSPKEDWSEFKTDDGER